MGAGAAQMRLASSLRQELIRRRLVGRLLPRVYAVDVWDGPGDGRSCDGCALPVTNRQHAVEAIASRWLSMYCHARCFDIWESERRAISGIATSVKPLGGPPQGSLLLKGGSLSRRSSELVERSRVILARSRGLIAKSNGRI
jgi:hypothetical protein